MLHLLHVLPLLKLLELLEGELLLHTGDSLGGLLLQLLHPTMLLRPAMHALLLLLGLPWHARSPRRQYAASGRGRR